MEAGAAPRAQLERAEAGLADAQDAALLRKTLYGSDLTEELADAMTAAAERRLGRRQADLAEAEKLVEAGAATRFSLTPLLEELDRARKERDLADSRARLCRELAQVARLEEEYQREAERASSSAQSMAERFDGSAGFQVSDFHMLRTAYEGHFGSQLPVSAMGETAVHRALGFDHRDRVDVAVHPDHAEGVWLRRYLESRGIPYIAFRQAVRGKATGAHIHIGRMSPRLGRTETAVAGGS